MLLDLSEGAYHRRRHCASGAAGYPCKMCTAGRYSPWYARKYSLYEAQYGHAPECEECEAGRYSTPGADECRYCPADTFSKSGWSECFDCPGKTSSTGCKSYDVWLMAFQRFVSIHCYCLLHRWVRDLPTHAAQEECYRTRCRGTCAGHDGT